MMRSQFCDTDYDEDDLVCCPCCHADMYQKTPYLGAHDDDMPQTRRDWRSGSSAAQRQLALNAKATLAYLKAHPEGATKDQIRADGITPALMLLESHGLANWNRIGHERRPGESAIWHATNHFLGVRK